MKKLKHLHKFLIEKNKIEIVTFLDAQSLHCTVVDHILRVIESQKDFMLIFGIGIYLLGYLYVQDNCIKVLKKLEQYYIIIILINIIITL